MFKLERRLMKRLLVVLGVLTGAAITPAAEPVADALIAQKFEPSCVRVEYVLQFDNADSPEVGGLGERCPNCGQYHSLGDGSELVRQERPLEAAGFLLSPDEVLTADPMIHSRFIKSITVCYQNERICAAPKSYAVDHAAAILKLEKPLAQTRPIEFVKNPAGPFKALSYSRQNGQWTINISVIQDTFGKRQAGQPFLAGPSGSLIIDLQGSAIGVCMAETLPIDGTWQQSPANWPMLTVTQMDEKLKNLAATASDGILRVKLNFRSPRNSKDSSRYFDREDSESVTEMNQAGLLIDPNHVLILAKLSPQVTARLEQIRVHPTSGEPVKAVFEGTLTDYGALVVRLEQPLKGQPIRLCTEPITNFDQKILLYVEAKIQGENRIVHCGRNRIASFSVGWRQQIEPALSVSAENRFLFDLDNQLVALPLSRRSKIENEQDRWMSVDATLIACCYLKPTLAMLKDNTDADNIPLTEDQENRIAWLGAELQSLSTELARIQNVSALTDDGQTGAMVSYIYEDSPASQAGLEIGDILLRVHVDNQPLPLEVSIDDDMFDQTFPWEQLGDLPEEYYDRIPAPWPNMENEFIRALTNLGFGTRFRAEIWRNNQTIIKDFVVTQSPPHYASAKTFKSEPLGMTVRNITYEVRRYFRMAPEDPGVIVSKLQTGSKAAVAGIRPYEVVTHINDEPILDASGFEKSIQAGGDLKLSLKRMNKGRVVTLYIAPQGDPSPAPAPGPSDI